MIRRYSALSAGKLKTKRFNSLVESVDSKRLGPYAGGQFSTSSGKTAKLTEIKFSQMAAGLNEEKVILGKVICSLQSLDGVPL